MGPRLTHTPARGRTQGPGETSLLLNAIPLCIARVDCVTCIANGQDCLFGDMLRGATLEKKVPAVIPLRSARVDCVTCTANGQDCLFGDTLRGATLEKKVTAPVYFKCLC